MAVSTQGTHGIFHMYKLMIKHMSIFPPVVLDPLCPWMSVPIRDAAAPGFCRVQTGTPMDGGRSAAADGGSSPSVTIMNLGGKMDYPGENLSMAPGEANLGRGCRLRLSGR